MLEAATRISTLSPSPFTAIIHTLLNDPTQSLKKGNKKKSNNILFYRKEQATDIFIFAKCLFVDPSLSKQNYTSVN